MCGIVGLHLRTPELYPRLGELLAAMLGEMSDRGADSAGIAVYGDPEWSPYGQGCVSVTDVADMPDLGPDVDVVQVDSTYLLSADMESEELLGLVRVAYPTALISGFGPDLAVLKGVGHPRALTEAWGLSKAQGWQGVGHTRMATESAVTPSGCHPYTVGPGQCLVHNGSFANHATIRRELRRSGVVFDSENDTEVGARFVAEQLAAGRDVATALKELCATFDGFYTLLVSDHDSFAVVRDAIACKPAVIAETADWVAMASEYRALAGLPGVEQARIWEPEPEVVYAWTR
ncbi:glutamine amidotransferase [Mycolicibacterium fortuitum]|uniref:Glutamine amidotransferase n=1 Tax=Mycolicibacterium fortuitum subsp. fortuitum DSM 46621 = ATCC 6841 = JCM 6387 TaxID=1214102 RepID=K0VRY0_MYCFO|nr:glutamine amidotransferase [Mycolicibacterium fortuitum]AIY48706.1 Glutamine amidotransferase protein GlxB [Mycobacterium sp. VKM Ac-1817D]CRL81780.1 glutamine amidotransferase [Mycolicibacter nonchromogenicus]AMD56054.1 glutamine amidotransferase [Mycolicibacterium fortuitum subsp. fortuitum DSM 46621 = ATCC 6841 = JCM 6387]EJZ14094.1 glutamine amidotransferase [Mycolicibacterium fortuitum subsp. fortuitum DSM 46621 = ATCC 6841 = JCM 6387]MCA4722538.1 glutamine amidotransferase [Mycoliciba